MAMKRPMTTAMALIVLTLAGATVAEDKANPTGTWTWKFSNQTGIHTLKLKLDGEKLTGSIKNYQNDLKTPIEDAAYKDGMVSFKHTYKARDGQKMVASYTGTVTEDTIKGTIEFKHPDRTRSIDWEAKREEELP
jgi:hypothetical protein